MTLFFSWPTNFDQYIDATVPGITEIAIICIGKIESLYAELRIGMIIGIIKNDTIPIIVENEIVINFNAKSDCLATERDEIRIMDENNKIVWGDK